MGNGDDIDLTEFDADSEPSSSLVDPAAEGAPSGDSDDGFGEKSATDLGAVFDVPVNISAVLGRTHMEVSELLKLKAGNIVELDRKVGEAIDIFVNNRLVARGEVVMVENRLGVTMTEIIKNDQH